MDAFCDCASFCSFENIVAFYYILLLRIYITHATQHQRVLSFSFTYVSFQSCICLLYYRSNTIVSYKGFPIYLPDPEWAVDTTLKNWKKHLKNDADNSADLLGHLIERSDMIRHLGETNPCENNPLLPPV